MNERIGRLRELAANGNVYESLRGALALRPVPEGLTKMLGLSQPKEGPVRDLIGRSLSEREAGPADEGLIAAIRAEMPGVQDWPIRTGPDLAAALLPPGFEEGRPCAYLRLSRALVDSGKSIRELIEEQPDAEAFAQALRDFGFEDTIDLLWRTPAAIELRDVQDLAEKLVPKSGYRRAVVEDPRYEAALSVYADGVPGPLASGGLLAKWPRAAHLRLFVGRLRRER